MSHFQQEWSKQANPYTAAAQYLEQTARWSGRKLETGTAEAVNTGSMVGGRLIKGTGYDAEEVSY